MDGRGLKTICNETKASKMKLSQGQESGKAHMGYVIIASWPALDMNTIGRYGTSWWPD